MLKAQLFTANEDIVGRLDAKLDAITLNGDDANNNILVEHDGFAKIAAQNKHARMTSFSFVDGTLTNLMLVAHMHEAGSSCEPAFVWQRKDLANNSVNSHDVVRTEIKNAHHETTVATASQAPKEKKRH
jgi:hypothetical protein